MHVYRPRGMPSRFMAGAPEIVRRGVIDIIATRPEPLDFDVILRPEDGETLITGLDFGMCGSRGCHFFLERHDARAYRERSRRKRVAWADLPEPTRAAILYYLEEQSTMSYPLTTPLSDALAAAVAAGACADATRVLRSLDKPGLTLADLLSHPRASYWAFWYARGVIRARWPEAEATISTNPAHASWYARDVIRARWPEAEATVSTNPEHTYLYARDVIRARWPEAEATIASDPEWAYRYARDVIRARWPEAEATISTNPEHAFWYARGVPGVPADWRESIQ